jgi:hypothetical protein
LNIIFGIPLYTWLAQQWIGSIAWMKKPLRDLILKRLWWSFKTYSVTVSATWLKSLILSKFM